MKLSEQVTTSIFEHCQYDLDRFATPTMSPRVLTEEVVKCLAWTLAVDTDAREAFRKLVENTFRVE